MNFGRARNEESSCEDGRSQKMKRNQTESVNSINLGRARNEEDSHKDRRSQEIKRIRIGSMTR